MDLIADFEAHVANTTAPPRFRRWAGIALAAATIARNAHVVVAGRPIYPNLIVVLVGPSGTGKNSVIEPAKGIFKGLLNGTKETELAPDKTSLRRLVARLATPKPVDPDAPINAIDAVTAAFANEFRVLVPADDIKMMEVLSDLYECQDEWHGETQHAGCDHLYNLCFNILGGTQPNYFSAASGFSQAAIGQGILARYVVVYADEKRRLALTQDPPPPRGTEAMSRAFASMRAQVGRVPFAPAAFAAFTRWYDGGCAPAPTHPILAPYGERRHVLAAKLALIRALTRGHREVREEDWADALAWQEDAEEHMPAALTLVGASPTHLFEASFLEWARGQGRPVAEAEARRQLARNISGNQVDAVVEHLVAAGQLKVDLGERPRRTFSIPA